MIVLLIIVVISGLIWYYYRSNLKPKNLNNGLRCLPRAPGGIPGFGHFFFVGDRPFEYFQDMAEKMGPIFTIQIGWKDIIVMNDYNTIFKTLKQQGDNFSGRWENIFSKELAHDCGIFFKEKEWWAQQRSFTLRVLRDFGFGKLQTEKVVRQEGEKIYKVIDENLDQEMATNDMLSIATVNTISDFIMKKEYEYDDKNVLRLLTLIRKTAQAADINNLLVNVYPVFGNFPKLSTFLLATFNDVQLPQTLNEIYDFVREDLKQHRSEFEPTNETRDLMDAFLLEQHQSKFEAEKETTFIDWQLIRLTAELFFAGFETTASTLSWSLMLMARHPEEQDRVYAEIIGEIGSDRHPEMKDKKNLNYVQAVMDEVYRVSSLVPLSVPHTVFENASVNGMHIPARSVIITNLYACHRDPTLWQKPHDFFPDHFLAEDGSGQYRARPELMPFGIGRRQCLGESLARVEYFVLFVMLMQRYRVRLGSEAERMTHCQLYRGTKGVVRGPVDHTICFSRR